jgi:hypothetical protein
MNPTRELQDVLLKQFALQKCFFVTMMLHCVPRCNNNERISDMKKQSKGRSEGKPVPKNGGTMTAGKRKAKQMAVQEVKTAESDVSQENLAKLPAYLRFGTVSIEEIQNHAQFLSEQSAQMMRFLDEMRRLSITKIDQVDGVTKAVRGKKLIAEFSANINRALTNFRFS